MTATPGNGEEPVDDPMTFPRWGAFLLGIAGGVGITFTILGAAGAL